MTRLSFYDPLFETIDFEKELYLIDPMQQLFSFNPKQIFERLLHTYEMSRLLFLHQAGLNFLVFPSATHNRFTHCLGCWLLGTYALESVKVHYSGLKVERSLKRWLYGNGKLLEFLLALLLHDCGHGPFSHVLENNPDLDYSHEDITAQFIRGEGKYYKILKERVSSEETIDSVLSEYKNIDIEFITGLVAYPFEKFKEKWGSLVSLKDLVDSSIDLDRLDHYLRDSRFMGIKFGEFNILALLENIIIYPEEKVKYIRIREEGVPHVLNLLYSKELIWMIAFDSPEVRAYESMLNKAVSIAVKTGELKADEIPLLSEDELLYRLKICQNGTVRTLLKRLLSREPYLFVCSCRVPADILREDIDIKIEEIMKKAGFEEEDLLVYIPFKEKPKQPVPWLKLYTEDGSELSEKHPGFNIAIWEKEKQIRRTIKFFAKDKKVKEKAEWMIRKSDFFKVV